MAPIHLKRTMTSSWLQYPHPPEPAPLYSASEPPFTWVPTSSSSPPCLSGSPTIHPLMCLSRVLTSLHLPCCYQEAIVKAFCTLCQVLKHLSVSSAASPRSLIFRTAGVTFQKLEICSTILLKTFGHILSLGSLTCDPVSCRFCL